MAKQGSSTFGIDYAVFGLISDDDGKLIADATKGLSESGIVLIDDDGEGLTTANITALEAAGTEQYANNQVKRVAHGVQRPQVAITALDMPFEISRKLTGYFEDTNGGSVLSSGKKPHVAMLLASHDFKGNFHFDCFANGEMILPTRNHGTNNANETDANVAFTYQSLAPISDDIFMDDKGVQQPYKYWNSGLATFNAAAMLKEVFGGYVGENIISNRTAKNAAAGSTATSSTKPGGNI